MHGEAVKFIRHIIFK